MTTKKERKILFSSTGIKSFFLYYFIGCVFVLASAFLFKYLKGDIIAFKNIVIAMLASTGIVLVSCPIILFRKIEVCEERIIIRWSFLKKKKSIPLCLVDHFEKSNFLATPAIKVFFKSGRVEKIPFIDKSKELIVFLDNNNAHLAKSTTQQSNVA